MSIVGGPFYWRLRIISDFWLFVTFVFSEILIAIITTDKN